MAMIKKLTLAAALAAPLAIVAPAQAQVASVAVADPESAIQDSTAWKTAAQQIQTTYKAQIDQAQARQAAIQGELKPLVDAFEAARRAANPNQQSLQTQAQQIQAKENAANKELQTMLVPVQRARAYALEQLTKQLGAAVNAAVARKKVGMLLRPNEVLYVAPTGDITADVTAELNRLVPSVSITPPANWQPGQQGAPAQQPQQQGR